MASGDELGRLAKAAGLVPELLKRAGLPDCSACVVSASQGHRDTILPSLPETDLCEAHDNQRRWNERRNLKRLEADGAEMQFVGSVR